MTAIFEFLESNSDNPSKYKVSGKNKSCKVTLHRLLFSAASSRPNFSVAGVEVSIVLQLENRKRNTIH